jgi:hypothetical protein
VVDLRDLPVFTSFTSSSSDADRSRVVDIVDTAISTGCTEWQNLPPRVAAVPSTKSLT